MRSLVMTCLAIGMMTSLAAAEKVVGPIKELTLKANGETLKKVLAKSGRNKPVLIKDAAAAAKLFTKDELKALTKELDFKTQKLVVFAWRGSGQDKMTTVVMESYPEQVRFVYSPGRTRDLRQHFKAFALRKNVTYSCK